jgi:hypothetical protein
MQTRRAVVSALGIGVAAVTAARAADAIIPHLNADSPQAAVVPGKPPVLAFNDGLKIPCDKSAFLTLFEGKTFWLTLGAGRSDYLLRAQGLAVHYAQGAMKLLLLTLAFAPERLIEQDGGWRLKSKKVSDFVRGDIDLPGKPYWPINDTDLRGGALGTPNVVGGDGFASGSGSSQGDGTASSGTFGNLWPPSDLNKVSAFTSYMVLKRDADLDYVRRNAQVVPM